MKKKEEKKRLFEPGTGKVLKRQLIAAKAYYSSEMEKLRQESLKHGAAPWKILSYQRVVDPDKLPIPLTMDSYVKPETFETQMRYISRECKPLRLGELCSLVAESEPIPDKAVVVTLDGGFMDTYLYAFPILLKYMIPATIFLATGYIDTNLFFYENRLVLSLMAFQKGGIRAPYFEALGKEFYENLAKVSPDKTINHEVINLMVDAFRTLPLRERGMAMMQLAETVESVGGLPEFEDFMRWDDVRHMRDKGFDFGSMGHYAVSNPGLDAEQFAVDIDQSYKLMVEQEVKPEKVFAFPPGVRSVDTLETLRAINCVFAAERIPYPEPRFQTTLPMILGRIPIFEACAYRIELFAARVWQLEISGLQY